MFQVNKTILSARVQLPPQIHHEEFLLEILGKCHVPKVAVTEPLPGTLNNELMLKYPVTLVGNSLKKTFKIQNSGGIQCRAILEVDWCGYFSLYPSESTKQMLIDEGIYMNNLKLLLLSNIN